MHRTINVDGESGVGVRGKGGREREERRGRQEKWKCIVRRKIRRVRARSPDPGTGHTIIVCVYFAPVADTRLRPGQTLSLYMVVLQSNTV